MFMFSITVREKQWGQEIAKFLKAIFIFIHRNSSFQGETVF